MTHPNAHKDRYYLRQRKCWRKRGHWKTKTSARKRAKEIFKRAGIRMYPYDCLECGDVHLTKSISVKGVQAI